MTIIFSEEKCKNEEDDFKEADAFAGTEYSLYDLFHLLKA